MSEGSFRAAKSVGMSEEMLYVYPPEFAFREGEGVSGTQSAAGRFQTIYHADGFAELPSTHRFITGLRWRPDSSVTSNQTTTWPNFELRLSTTRVLALMATTVYGRRKLVQLPGALPILLVTLVLLQDRPSQAEIRLGPAEPFDAANQSGHYWGIYDRAGRTRVETVQVS